MICSGLLMYYPILNFNGFKYVTKVRIITLLKDLKNNDYSNI